jgi:hypothetical protein
MESMTSGQLKVKILTEVLLSPSLFLEQLLEPNFLLALHQSFLFLQERGKRGQGEGEERRGEKRRGEERRGEERRGGDRRGGEGRGEEGRGEERRREKPNRVKTFTLCFSHTFLFHSVVLVQSQP